MPFIGNQPTAVPLTSADLGDGIVTSAKIADGTIASADLASGVGGITEADQWRLSADTSVSGTQSITTNWEKADNTNAGFIGSGMTESSGVFTFPSTGIYLINFQFTTESSAGGDTTISMVIQATTDNSSYSTVSKVDDSETTNRNTTGFLQYFFDVTSTTNCKVKFGVESYDAGILGGNTAFNKTSAYFIRLGDT